MGITDLFSILLPGARIAYVAIRLDVPWLTGVSSRLRLEGNGGYLAFFVAAYVLGHLLDMAGAFFLDRLYDVTYARRKRRSPDSAMRDPLLEEATRLALPTMPTGDRVYQWSCSWACLKSPAAFTERSSVLQANSKFFRRLVSVFLIAAILLLVTRPHQGRVVAGELICCALAEFAFLRFYDLRWKAVQQTYRFFIAMQCGAPTGANPEPSAEEE